MRRRIAPACLVLVIVGLAGAPPPAAAQEGPQIGVQYGEADGVPLLMDVYFPSGERTGMGVIVIHGGRWMRGDRTDTPADDIASQGHVAFSVEYRLAPEYPYPAAIEDLQTAVRFVREHADEYGVDPAKIWAIGGSAGGHLAALLGTLGRGSTTEGARIAAAVSWSGPMDLELLAASSRGLERAATQFVGCSRAEDPACLAALRDASPVTHLDPSDPPLFIANGTAEPIPFDQAVIMAKAAEQAGVEAGIWTIQGNLHGFSYVREALAPTDAFVTNAIEGTDAPIVFPETPEIAVSSPPRATASIPEREQPGATGRRDEGNTTPLLLAILLGVAAATIGTVMLARKWRDRGAW
jgi:acetyl esterase/lipase